ncbi:AraC family transcriptional regulator [Cytophagales bacterium LB-30]|uniref:AraC family transcriptional regulator n=1 Tax=Shiella aurantiaca TaxID=3058365 RepID=A0ABT8F5B5_9BACT|nr:AraC family transcriptional regulator [Shiella aurantiaca]MDN4165632.1 AraC family transcriptional regulator [Shiella aurantiaca]
MDRLNDLTKEHKPSQKVKPLVEFLWHTHNTGEKLMGRVLPVPFAELVLVRQGRFDLFDVQGNCLNQNRKQWIAGIQTEARYCVLYPDTEMIGLAFSPCGLSAFYPQPVKNLVNRYESDTSALEVFSPLFSFFQNHDLPNTHWEDLLLSLPQKSIPSHIQDSCERLLRQNLSVKELATQFRISEKSLIQGFNRHVGLSPLRYKKLLSFEKALRAEDFPYYDQSHAIRAYQTLGGLTPAKYSKEVKSGKVHPRYPHFMEER